MENGIPWSDGEARRAARGERRRDCRLVPLPHRGVRPVRSARALPDPELLLGLVHLACKRNIEKMYFNVCITGALSCRVPSLLDQNSSRPGCIDHPVVTFLLHLHPSPPFLSCPSDDGDRATGALPWRMYFATATVTIAIIAFPPHNPLGPLPPSLAARSLALHSYYSGKVLWRVIDVLRR